MWILSKGTGFISVVAHDTDPDSVRVRARKREHLAKAFPLADIIELADADYRWHANVPRLELIAVIVGEIDDMDYTSHVKEEVTGDDRQFYGAMLACWSALYRMQQDDAPDDEPLWVS